MVLLKGIRNEVLVFPDVVDGKHGNVGGESPSSSNASFPPLLSLPPFPPSLPHFPRTRPWIGFTNQSSRSSESSAAAVLVKAEAAIVRMARAQERDSRIVGVWERVSGACSMCMRRDEKWASGGCELPGRNEVAALYVAKSATHHTCMSCFMVWGRAGWMSG